jgi:type I restriction enzyme, S subunit
VLREIEVSGMRDTIPSTWRVVNLGDAVTLSRGKDLPVQTRTRGPYPVVGSNGIVGYHSSYAAKSPGVLVGRSGSVGEVAWVEEDYWPLNTTLWVTDFHGNDPRFISFFLRYLDLGRFTGGVSVPTLNRNVLHRISVQIPPVTEQRTISHVLQAVQKAREIREREATAERECKAALMQHLFSQDERCQTELLGNVCKVRYGLGQPPQRDSAGVPIIRATDIKSGRIDSETVISVARHAIPTGRNAFLSSGEIIVVRSGAYTGDVAMYDGRWPEAVAGYDLVATVASADIQPEFLAYFLLGETAQRYFRSQRDRAAQPHLNAQQLRNTPVIVPPLNVQTAVVTTLHACDDKLHALECECRLLEELLDGALDELMRGGILTRPHAETCTAI